MKKIKINEVLLKDALFNTHEKSGASTDYGRGIIVGIASALMAVRDIPLLDALDIIERNLPTDWREECMPESWRY